MSLSVGSEGTSTFIIPIFSGTSNESVKHLIPGSSYVIASVPLYISDISLETALFLMKTEIDEKIILKIPNINLFLYSLGPIPRLIQFSVEYLKKQPNSSLKGLYTHMKDQVKHLYKLFFNQRYTCILLVIMVDQLKLNVLKSSYEQAIKQLIESGQIFQRRDDTLMMPLIFIDLLFEKVTSEWGTLKNYISRGIKGEIFPVDLELFPCYFYSFKIHLYQTLNITSMNMRDFFKGVYMKEVKYYLN